MTGLTLATPGASLAATFLDASRRFPDRLALAIGDRQLSYRELADIAGRIARALQHCDRPHPRLGAVLAARSETAYAGVLGTLLSGAGYVPLNPKFPIRRTAHMLNVSASRTLIVGSECLGLMDELLALAEQPLLIVAPTVEKPDELRALHARHTFVGARELAMLEPSSQSPAVDPAEIAYLLFTSGSTGAPKGVMVAHANALPFLEAVWRRYDIGPEDRFSQTFDLTFDLSVFDLFACWGRGASLHPFPAEGAAVPDEFVRSHALTVWFSVPSLAMMLRDLRRLRPGAFPSLRWSLFCGERLPIDIASAWQTAAPASIVENLYGPTEATIACTLYRWDAEAPMQRPDGTVPIGAPFPGMTAAIVDSELAQVAVEQRGELCVKGPQITHGYWRDHEKTRDRFVPMPWYDGPDNRWYRTGDIAYVTDAGVLIHCGRNDDQVKFRGFRIELAEIEHVLCRAAGTSFAVVVPYPSNQYGLLGLTAVVAANEGDEDALVAQLREALPEYMVPSRVVFVAELPLNANGKIDRAAVMVRLQRDDQS